MNNLQILWVARSYSLPETGVKEHTHPYYHMFYVVNGNCIFYSNGKRFSLNAGEGLLVPKHAKHSFSVLSGTPAKYLEIKFTVKKTDMDNLYSRETISFGNDNVIDYLIEKIVMEFQTPGNLSGEAASSYLFSVLSLLTEKMRHSESNNYRFIDANGYSKLSGQIVKYLEENYSKNISLDDIAAALGYNKSYLCVAFKNDTQTTILDCLNTIRVRRAAELITYSEEKLSNVASLCGFSSVSHFTRVFQKHVGITPGQIRRAYPADILTSDYVKRKELAEKPDRFMYSVLAKKNFSLGEICGDLNKK